MNVYNLETAKRDFVWHSRYVENFYYPKDTIEGAYRKERKEVAIEKLKKKNFELAKERGMCYGDFIEQMREQEKRNAEARNRTK